MVIILFSCVCVCVYCVSVLHAVSSFNGVLLALEIDALCRERCCRGKIMKGGFYKHLTIFILSS